MLARKCDRCGKLYELCNKGKTTNGIKLIDRYLDDSCCCKKIYDLCPECMKALEEFLG